MDGSDLRARWGTKENCPLVGNVAALVGKKGHVVFFRAAARVREHIPACRFVCVGAGTWKQKGDKLELQDDRITYSGELDGDRLTIRFEFEGVKLRQEWGKQ